MRIAVVQRAKNAGWQDFAFVWNKGVLQDQVAAHRGAHAHGIPFALEGDAGSIFRDLQVEGAIQPGAIPDEERWGGVIMRSSGQRDKKLASIEKIAAIHFFGGGAKTPSANPKAHIRLSQFNRFTM